jgi:hypothetical protein
MAKFQGLKMRGREEERKRKNEFSLERKNSFMKRRPKLDG